MEEKSVTPTPKSTLKQRTNVTVTDKKIETTPTPRAQEQDKLDTTPTPKQISTVAFSNDVKDYQILQEVGRGEYGHVYKCKYLKNGQVYALKIQDIPNDDFSKLGNALIESDILARFQHPHLLRGYHSFFSKNPFEKKSVYSIINVVEYAEQTLDEKYLSSLGPMDICIFLRQLLLGLDFLHSHGQLHDDLKPENLFLVDGVVKIGDFGIAQRDLPHTKSAAIHAVFYRPPEAFIGGPISTKSDIWAIGVLLVTILTGKSGYFGKAKENYPMNIWTKLGVPSPEWLLKHRIDYDTFKHHYNFLVSRFSKNDPGKLEEVVTKGRFRENKTFCQLLFGFLNKTLQVEPENRSSARDLLSDPLFQSLPKLSGLSGLSGPRSFYYSGKEEIVKPRSSKDVILSNTDAIQIIEYCREKKLMETTIVLALDLAYRYFTVKTNPEFTFEESRAVFACISAFTNESFSVDIDDYLPKKQEGKLEKRIMIRNIASVCYALDFRLYIDNIATVCRQDPKTTLDLVLGAYSKPKVLAKFYARDFESLCREFWFINTDF